MGTMPLDESTKTDKTLVIEDVTPLENKAYYAALATVVALLALYLFYVTQITHYSELQIVH